ADPREDYTGSRLDCLAQAIEGTAVGDRSIRIQPSGPSAGVERGSTRDVALRQHLHLRKLSRGKRSRGVVERGARRPPGEKCPFHRKVKLSAHPVGDTRSRVDGEDWIRPAAP